VGISACRFDILGPDDHLLAALPLSRHDLLRDLKSALVDREVAKDGLCLQLQQRLSYGGVAFRSLGGGGADERVFCQPAAIPSMLQCWASFAG
jgi:hypothetical protein